LQEHRAHYTEAIDKLYFLNRAVLESPNDPAVWTARGDLHFSKDLGSRGKPVRGMADYDRAISIDPQFIEAWRGKGYALFAQGKYREAIEALTTAIAYGNNSAGSYLRRGICFRRTNETGKAKDDFVYVADNHMYDEKSRSFAALMIEGIIG